MAPMQRDRTMSDTATPSLNRRRLIELVGASVGGAAAYQVMTRLGFASESPYRGPIKLDGDPKGASVVILGAGLAGMTAAIELERAEYRVSVLEFNLRPGGRNWTLRGGDVYTELGGATQTCEFDPGLYINPGPWRIPYHHHAILDYCRRFGVTLEPFIQLNHNAFLHSSTAFDGKPQRIRDVKADFAGGVSELLAKATRKGALDDEVSTEDREILLEALRSIGALDKDFRYKTGEDSAYHRGYAKDPGGGLGGALSAAHLQEVQHRTFHGELDVQHVGAIRHRRCAQPMRRDIERNVPPMILQRCQRQPRLPHAAGASQRHHAHLGILIRLRQRRGQPRVHVLRQRVLLFRAIKPDNAHGAVITSATLRDSRAIVSLSPALVRIFRR